MWNIEFLFDALKKLYWPANEQINWCKEEGVPVSELALEFDDAYQTLRSNDTFQTQYNVNDAQMKKLDEINKILDKISGIENSAYWTPKALKSKMEWAQIRKLSQELLELFQINT